MGEAVAILIGLAAGAAAMWWALTATSDPWRDVRKGRTTLQQFRDAEIGVPKKKTTDEALTELEDRSSAEIAVRMRVEG